MKKIKTILSTALLLLISNYVLAQETEKKELAKLSFLMGNWSGISSSFTVKDTTQVKVRESVNYIMDGNILTLDVVSANIQIHTLITYSIKDKCYYYQPYTKTGGGKYKGKLQDNKFIVYFNEKNRLIFEKTVNGEFHEYGESLVNEKWKKYFEDILLPASTTNYTKLKAEKITKEYIDPITALTNVISVEHENFKTIYIAGQVGTGNTKEKQLETAYKAIEKRLAQANASFSDLVEMKIYIVDYDPNKDLKMFFRVREKLYGDLKMPPNVFIGISSLYSKDKKIELSGTAIVIK
ncbi:RidA family protein [Polaribacter sp. WD7]|uniref:RidA family protein n=1 Tax=Polaribacter sp. WD7 TaxID=2269061 RepID=UPI000DF4C0DB|nr:Rid family hydrolase [Polaribacter sp. WD7]RCS26770.1 RidA family protein [Polaribacter sp. WD7]